MKPRISLVTLGVDDLKRSLAFYRALGFYSDGIVGAEFEHGAVAFFDLQNGLRLAIWERKNIAHESKVEFGPKSATEFMLAHNVGSKEEVDAIIADAVRAGATITDPPHVAFWGGYTSVFQDPDGHLWEVAWNPDWEEERVER